ncbi:MAG TPA: hypothetical protein VN025_14180 [Candidatus Dormibacteraeota bacterium]|jgi:hypothetical protein|nr:hypothetical protein [Candidatus Dormibacteraeota bacterium]
MFVKFLKHLSLVIVLLLPATARSAAQAPNNSAAQSSSQAPDEMIKKLADLVHAGRYDEARQSVAGLLILYPDDQRLVKAKALLDNAPTAASPAPTTLASNPASGESAPSQSSTQLTGMDRVDYEALLDLAHQAQQNSDLAQQKILLQQFMNQSGPFIQKHPEQSLIWQLRAAAAISLNDPEEGYNAGQKLLAAGAADTNDPNLMRLMAQLKNKNWLDLQGVADAKAKIEEDKKYGWLVGTWTGVNSWFQKAAFDYGKRQNNVKIEFVRSGSTVVGYIINQKTNMRFGVPILQYTVTATGKPDASAWTYNIGTPIKWQPIDSFILQNGSATMELNMKYEQTKFVFNKLSDDPGDAPGDTISSSNQLKTAKKKK